MCPGTHNQESSGTPQAPGAPLTLMVEPSRYMYNAYEKGMSVKKNHKQPQWSKSAKTKQAYGSREP